MQQLELEEQPVPVLEFAKPEVTAGGQIEIAANAAEVKRLAAADLDVIAMLAAPDDVTLEFPEFYKQLWRMLCEKLIHPKDFSRFAIGLPRGHAKTFFCKLLALYIILFTDRRYILIVSASEDRAENIVSDICDMLDTPNIREVFGNWRYALEINRQDFKSFNFNGRPVLIKAAGAGTSVRGIQVKNSRPDVILCDDVQSRESAESVTESKRAMLWFVATLLKVKSPVRCTTIYVGNMYKDIEIQPGMYTCILRNLQLSKHWISLVVGAILADGSALWEELHSKENLLSEYENDLALGCPEVFYAEVLNSPTMGTSRYFDISKVSPYNIHPQDNPQGAYVIIDPSGHKKTSDDTAIGYFEVYDGVPVLRRLVSSVMTPMQTIREAILLCAQYGASCIGVEGVAYQSTLIFWFKHFLEQYDLTGIEVVELSTGGVSKNARIIQLFKMWAAKEILMSSDVHATVTSQAVAFDALKKDNKDDILDVCFYGKKLFTEFPEAVAISGIGEQKQESDYMLTYMQDEIPTDCLMG